VRVSKLHEVEAFRTAAEPLRPLCFRAPPYPHDTVMGEWPGGAGY
jgi:hypothetical protein